MSYAGVAPAYPSILATSFFPEKMDCLKTRTRCVVGDAIAVSGDGYAALAGGSASTE
jgi:hypothetical protein